MITSAFLCCRTAEFILLFNLHINLLWALPVQDFEFCLIAKVLCIPVCLFVFSQNLRLVLHMITVWLHHRSLLQHTAGNFGWCTLIVVKVQCITQLGGLEVFKELLSQTILWWYSKLCQTSETNPKGKRKPVRVNLYLNCCACRKENPFSTEPSKQ